MCFFVGSRNDPTVKPTLEKIRSVALHRVLFERSVGTYHDQIDVIPMEHANIASKKKFPAAMSIPKTRRFADSSARRDNNRRIMNSKPKPRKFLRIVPRLQRSILKCRETHFVQIFISNQSGSFQYVLLILGNKCIIIIIKRF